MERKKEMTKPPIALNDEFLRHEMPVSWTAVWNFWRKNEEELPHWIEYWQAKGFESWDQWRQERVDHYGLQSLRWHYYRVEMPYSSIPQFRGGPYKGWIEKYYKGRHLPTFERLAKDARGINLHPGIKDLLADFPTVSVLLGIVINGKVYIIEGMHRCAALALIANQGTSLRKKLDIHIALAQWPTERGELPEPK